ncbi:hypothetical protein [Elizabethkingia sp. JS20170427COW]|uniref:hypothetical protein n=1 Tax=Elizabethkingia sp. JS20170427COW TaxID=2583851 RepID=UPI0011108462|nr:hypothetical protein [Elizabethkingia sp. JS20170427COW]QCX53601.1 hypothetical protein FGE20_07575 [Elizabethkingia sp. JS20170427COW]
MIRKKFIFLLLTSLLSVSCSVETLSYNSRVERSQNPMNLISSNKLANETINTMEINVEQIKYISDLTNLINVFPKFHHSVVNDEVKNLKVALQAYIYSITEKNTKQKRKSYQDYVKSYRTLQKIKKYMNQDEKELLDRYLTRIKANVNSLEYIS